jgi:hypothetical protein
VDHQISKTGFFVSQKAWENESLTLMEPRYWFLEPINADLLRKKVGKGPDDP